MIQRLPTGASANGTDMGDLGSTVGAENWGIPVPFWDRLAGAVTSAAKGTRCLACDVD